MPEGETTTRIYVILERTANDDVPCCYVDVARIEARNEEHALRQVHEQLYADEHTRTFVAIPERGWRPKTVGTEARPSKVVVG